jgi:hypothetical protein
MIASSNFLSFILLLSRQKFGTLVFVRPFFVLQNRPSNSIHATAAKTVGWNIVIYHSVNHYSLACTKVVA